MVQPKSLLDGGDLKLTFEVRRRGNVLAVCVECLLCLCLPKPPSRLSTLHVVVPRPPQLVGLERQHVLGRSHRQGHHLGEGVL